MSIASSSIDIDVDGSLKSDVIVRGNLITVTASPKDTSGNPTSPASVGLYLTYTSANGAETSVGPISMTSDTSGATWTAQFDTSVAKEGPIFGSVRAISPAAAGDFKRRLVANPANPDPAT